MCAIYIYILFFFSQYLTAFLSLFLSIAAHKAIRRDAPVNVRKVFQTSLNFLMSKQTGPVEFALNAAVHLSPVSAKLHLGRNQ